MTPSRTLALEVAAVGAEALDVLRIELVDPAGGELPAFEPGAHLEVTLPNGMRRQYSLVNDWRERHRYVLGVGRSRAGRGGSNFVHEQARVGMRWDCRSPVNNFRLDPDASSYLLIGGGIGITPLVAMARWCAAGNKPWRLVYAARSLQRMAFCEELCALDGDVHLHGDRESGGPLDVAALLSGRMPGEQVYCCGPAALMDAVGLACRDLPANIAHFEWFSASPAETVDTEGFWIDLHRSGSALFVPPNQSVLEVLEAHGHEIPYSCREGLCGTCETGVCAGEPDHHDYVIAPAERASRNTMMVCVSRAKTPRLTLDL